MQYIDITDKWQISTDHGTSPIANMVGQTFGLVANRQDELLVFELADGSGAYVFYHLDDCCETVLIEDVAGDLEDLENAPLLMAEESVSDGACRNDQYESSTWTFYRFATIRGSVTVRWLGTSNGYYSERVDLSFVPAKDES